MASSVWYTRVLVLAVVAVGMWWQATITPAAVLNEDTTQVHEISIVTLAFQGLTLARHYHADNQAWARAFHLAHNLTGKRILLTGATKGLGRGIASHLHAFGAELVLPCRRCDFGEQRRQLAGDAKRVGAKYGVEAPNQAPPEYFDVDLADLDEIDALVGKLKEKGNGSSKFDVVVLNAGLVSTTGAKTAQGFESTFGVNFVSNAYLFDLLVKADLLKQQGCRVVTVSSEEHRVTPPILSVLKTQGGAAFGAPWGSGVVDAMPRYDYSKLVLTTYFLGMARHHPELRFLDVCPGPVASDIAMNAAPWPLNVLVKHAMAMVMVSVDDGSIPVARLAVSPEYDSSVAGGGVGEHFHISQRRLARADARNATLQDLVIKWTNKLMQERHP